MRALGSVHSLAVPLLEEIFMQARRRERERTFLHNLLCFSLCLSRIFSFAGDLDGEGGHAHVKEGLDALGVLGRLEDVLAWLLMGYWCWGASPCWRARKRNVQRKGKLAIANCKSDCFVGEAPPR